MYSQQLQDYIQEISDLGEIQPETVNFLNESLACYLNALSNAVGAEMDPAADLLSTSLNLLFLSNGLAELSVDVEADGSHYLVGMGLEQSGELLARTYLHDSAKVSSPLINDHWYRLTLAFMHYMSGGFRVQALSVIRNLERIVSIAQEGDFAIEYVQAIEALRMLFAGREPSEPFSLWDSYIFGESQPTSHLGRRIFQLAQKIRYRRRVALLDLGEGNEDNWLRNRGIKSIEANKFWGKYLTNLEERGIISFTDEQIGPGFDYWLRPEFNLLVVLPTGSGKSIVAELKTALTLSYGKQVIWILPTRSLVRQAKRELSRAFRNLGVAVEELPTTEDFKPLYTGQLNQTRLVAATTPEKLAALIRSNRDSILNVGLVVLDEAQILFDLNRGTTAEYILQELKQLVPECKIVLMSAFLEYLDRLRNFSHRLWGQDAVRELISSNRPTRRICGVITNTVIEKINKPIIQIFPPGLQREDQETEHPYRLTFSSSSLPTNVGPTAIAQNFLRSISTTNLRAVTFVGRLDSTETQAEQIASNITEQVELPDYDLSRLRVELGRRSAIENPSIKGIAPHHAGLTSLEQHMVEKWTRSRIIKGVVATPTLAQGVNLPFDISILTFLTRRNTDTNLNEPISQSEIMNMLGRAGRAGYVSDGVCLIAIRNNGNEPTKILDNTRRYYFRSQEPTSVFLGLSRLMATATSSGVAERDWIIQLDRMNFSEAQTLVSFALNSITDRDNIEGSLKNRLSLFPSIQDLQEFQNDVGDILDVLTSHLGPLVRNILDLSENDPLILEILTRTGLPIEYLIESLSAIRGDYNLGARTNEQQILWADSIVRSSLEQCQERQWFKNLFSGLNLREIFPAIEQWRSGRPLVEIEQSWQFREREKQNRINIGRFFNHTVSLLAQFWGAISICEELVYPETRNRPLEHIQTFVREGISSITELDWLNGLGGLDRVLAHNLAQYTPENLDNRARLPYIRREVNRWRNNRNTIPINVIGDELAALTSILNEMQS